MDRIQGFGPCDLGSNPSRLILFILFNSFKMTVKVKKRKWGNSIGVIIHSEAVDKLNIKPEENLVIEISKKENVLKELFGAVKFKKPSGQILKDVRKEDLESKWMK